MRKSGKKWSCPLPRGAARDKQRKATASSQHPKAHRQLFAPPEQQPQRCPYPLRSGSRCKGSATRCPDRRQTRRLRGGNPFSCSICPGGGLGAQGWLRDPHRVEGGQQAPGSAPPFCAPASSAGLGEQLGEGRMDFSPSDDRSEEGRVRLPTCPHLQLGTHGSNGESRALISAEGVGRLTAPSPAPCIQGTFCCRGGFFFCTDVGLRQRWWFGSAPFQCDIVFLSLVQFAGRRHLHLLPQSAML